MISLMQIYYGLLVTLLITLFVTFKKTNKIYYWFIPLISSAIIVQAFSEILSACKIKGNGFVFHIYQPIEYTFIACFYYELLQRKIVKMMVVVSVAIMVLFSLIYYLINPASFYGFDFSDFYLEAIFVCIWVIIFFIELLYSEQQLNLVTYPAFWINSANLLFYAGCLFVMGFYFYLHETDKKLANRLLDINHYLNLILYFLYIIAFLCSKEKNK